MRTRTILILIVLSFLSVRPCVASVLLTFDGTLDLLQKELRLNIKPSPQGSIEATARQVDPDNYSFSFNCHDVKTPRFIFSSQIQSSLHIIQQAESAEKAIHGSIQSQYSLIDHKPANELSGEIEIRNHHLYVQSLAFGKVHGRGSVDLLAPYKVDMKLNLAYVDLPEFINFWVKNFEYDSSGAVSGEIAISGDIVRPHLKGSLESFNGFVGKLEYDSIHLNIEGPYPQMQIAHSTVSRVGGMSFSFEGPFDLSNTGFKKQIQSLALAPLVSDSASSREWTIKQTTDEDAAKTEIKYILRKNDQSGTPNTEATEMLSVQRTMEF